MHIYTHTGVHIHTCVCAPFTAATQDCVCTHMTRCNMSHMRIQVYTYTGTHIHMHTYWCTHIYIPIYGFIKAHAHTTTAP